MIKIAIGILVVSLLYLSLESATDAGGKQQFVFDVMCALETDSKAMLVEAQHMGKRLADIGIEMDDNEVNSAINHWLRVYKVNSYEELLIDPQFMIICKYNACKYEGKSSESCAREKVDSCFEYGLSQSECIG